MKYITATLILFIGLTIGVLLPKPIQEQEKITHVGAELATDKCPVCPECVCRITCSEDVRELNPIGEAEGRTYKIKDAGNFKIELDDGTVYEKAQIKADLTPLSISK